MSVPAKLSIERAQLLLAEVDLDEAGVDRCRRPCGPGRRSAEAAGRRGDGERDDDDRLGEQAFSTGAGRPGTSTTRGFAVGAFGVFAAGAVGREEVGAGIAVTDSSEPISIGRRTRNAAASASTATPATRIFLFSMATFMSSFP